MRFGIGTKIAILLIAVVGATAYSVARYLTAGSSDIVIDHELGDLSDEAMLRARELAAHLYAVCGDVRHIGDDKEKLQEFLLAGDHANPEPVANACGAAFQKLRPNYLRMEAWLRDQTQTTQLELLDEPSQRAQLVDEQAPEKSSIPDSRTVVAQLAAPEPFRSFLSEIGNATIKDISGERRIHAVWCGVRATAPASDRELYLLVLVDLDAPLPNGDESPLTAICNSPRHLTILANDPTTVKGLTQIDREAIRRGLVFLDETKQDCVNTGPMEATLCQLYVQRQHLTQEGADGQDQGAQSLPLLPRANSSVTYKDSVRLRKPLWFLQSDPIRDRAIRLELAKKIEELRRDPATLPPGTRVNGVRGTLDNIRLLANSEEAITTVASRIAEGTPVTWRAPVRCEHCNTRYALFPVRSTGVIDGYRYYGLAHSAFQEEMVADVRSELSKVQEAALWVVALVALIGFATSLFFTRPLKQITLVAQAVGKIKVDPDPASDGWHRELEKTVQMLPVRRHDEIGVLARAFQQMIDEVVAGQVRLQQLNADLDRRVTERTYELASANVELKAARDKADELSRAKDAFLASVSHELRNPLNQVSGFCQLLELSDLDEDQLADLKKIQLAGSQLLALINDILDYQKIVMGGITLEPEHFEVATLMNEVRDAMTFMARENNVDLCVDWSGDAGAIEADKQRLRQIIMNLVGNACKFTHDGTVHLHARRVQRVEGDGDDIVFSVEDTGRGMSPEEQAKLFTPFTKLAARHGNKSGTGLGLVISKGFCELMGGSISLASEFGKGTTFTVQIPAHTTYSPSGAAPAVAVAKSRGTATVADVGRSTVADVSGRYAVDRKRLERRSRDNCIVLVIDDDPNVRELMSRYLGAHGFDIRTATGGIEGLEMARELRPAVITLDAIMPGLDGWGVLAALKANEETADIPVVMVTMVDNQQRGQVMGADEFLVKPIDWDRLAQILSRYTTREGHRIVLIVEDESATREIMRRHLQHDGWTVLEAEHGAQALQILATTKPAVILLDLMMPVMDGFEFLDRRSEESRSIPVVVITAKDPTPEEYQRLNGRTARVLQKGQYTQEELLWEIHQWVDEHLPTVPAKTGEEKDA
jgi:signal transduction histidine kinase/DNA-binding response OmpR family regulator